MLVSNQHLRAYITRRRAIDGNQSRYRKAIYTRPLPQQQRTDIISNVFMAIRRQSWMALGRMQDAMFTANGIAVQPSELCGMIFISRVLESRRIARYCSVQTICEPQRREIGARNPIRGCLTLRPKRVKLLLMVAEVQGAASQEIVDLRQIVDINIVTRLRNHRVRRKGSITCEQAVP